MNVTVDILKKLYNITANEFVSGTVYPANSYVLYNGDFYKSNKETGSTGWIVADWNKINIVDAIDDRIKSPTTTGSAGMFLALDSDGISTVWKTAGSATAPVTSVQGMQGDVIIDGSEITIDKTTHGSITLNAAINSKANISDVYSKTETYTQTEINTALDNKANAATTYSKVEVDSALSNKVNSTDVYTKNNTYNKSEIDSLLGNKADSSTTYTKTEVDDALLIKVNKDDVYTKSQTYTKTEINTELNKKIDKPAITVASGNIPVSNGSGDVTWRSESVLSVNSKTGAVVLNALDVSAAQEVHSHNLSGIVDAGSSAALDADTTISATATGVPTTATIFTYLGNTYIPIPTTPGTNGQVLSTDGAGGYSWIENGSGSVVGVASINGKNGVVIINGSEINTTGDASSNTIAADIAAINTEVGKKYEKPASGIAKSDMATAIQSSLDKADTAYQKAATGISSTDMTTAVQNSLSKADTALQPSDIADWAKASTKPTYTYTEVGAAAATHTHLATDITNLGAAALLDTSSSVSSHSANKIYTSEVIYNNFLKNDATASSNVITTSSTSDSGLSISTGTNSTNLSSSNISISDGTHETVLEKSKITYDNGSKTGEIEFTKVPQSIAIGNTAFSNLNNAYTLAAGTDGQVLVTSSSGGAEWKTLTNTDVGAASASHTHDGSEITTGTIDAARIGTVNLDALTATATCATIPLSLLPSYVSNIVEVNSFSDLPTTGEANKIYLTKDTNKSYRWSGSSYIELNQSVAIGETELTAYRGDRGKIAYDHSQTQGSLGGAVSQGVYKVALSETGHVTGYAAVTKADIETICGSLGSIDTVSVNGTALPISSDKDVSLPISSTTTLGLAKPNGESIDAVSGVLYVKEATASDMAGRIAKSVINAYNYDTAVKQALTDNASSAVFYSDADKLAVRKLISTSARADVAANYDSSITYPEGTLVYDGDTLKRIVYGTPVASTVSDAIIAAGEKFKYHVDTDTDKRPVVSAPSTIADGATTDGYGSNAVYVQHSTGTFNATKFTAEESEIVISKSTNNGIKFSFT